jgi:preprotein translocase subunit SecD
MKLTWRIWVFSIVLMLSILAIVNVTGSVRLIVLILMVGAFYGLHKFELNKKGVLIFLGLSVVSFLLIFYSFQQGVVIKSIDKSSDFFSQGLRNGEIINSINGYKIENTADYFNALQEVKPSLNETKKFEIQTNKNSHVIFTNETPQIIVGEVSKTNIQTGLDLRGGARSLVQPSEKINEAELTELIRISRNRFNVYGLSDVQISGVRDLQGNRFMLVEVAGATPKDLEELISQQGKFEAKIANKTVFEGGKRDISRVCRNDASCAMITSCSEKTEGGYFCNFRFTVYLTEDAAKRHASTTENISVDDTGKYLSEKLYLYVDNLEVDSLFVSVDLKGQVTTQISVQGSGSGNTKEDAYNAARESMNKLQTILITGSLPYKLNIVKLDTISPTLGKNFIKLILIAGAIAIVLVAVIIFIKYRRIKASLALLMTSFSELIIILGVASFINWNLDLPSIAGILATIGTGVDSQIVILDEAEKKGQILNIRQKIKIALFIIITAYVTNVASLIPLYWAGAGLFKGFMITTIIGVTAGVFISRPAFADIIKKIEGD